MSPQVNVQEVVVHDDGTVEPETVVFVYRAVQPEPVNSMVTFHHVCDGASHCRRHPADACPQHL